MSYNISDEERQVIIAKGIFKTVLEKDTRYSEHRPIVIAFIKEGTKYIHGIVCHKDDEGKVNTNYWVAKIDKANAQIFEGQRWDLVDQYYLFMKEKHDYRDKRDRYYRETWYDLEHKAREEHGKIMAQWEQANPEPKDPFRKPCRVENGLCMTHGYSVSDKVACPQA